MRVWILILIFFLTGNMVFGQIETVELDEIVVEALPFEKYLAGSKIQKSDSMQLAQLSHRTLADYLKLNSTVYIKEQGNAMLASISFRGTGASHTGVFWHGININSLTLGSTDFNSVPIFLFDEVAIHYGGASALHGSDAIGGSVHVHTRPAWTKGMKAQIRQDVGSFGNVFTGIKMNFGNGRWESRTKVFNRLLSNNFTYKVTDRLGVESGIVQENAAVHNKALMQEFNTIVGKSGYLSLKGWYGENYHQIQPMMVSYKDQPQIGDELEDKNLRLLAEYQRYQKKGSLTAGLGYVWDYQVFNQSDLIETKRVIANLDYEWEITTSTTLKSGGNAQYIAPSVWSYPEDLNEWRGDVFLSLRQLLMPHWDLSLNVRRTFVPFIDAPVAPSISTSYKVPLAKSELLFRIQADRSYRVPTFNDRYWGDLGRKDLKPEQGYSTEAGFNLIQRLDGGGQFEFDVAGYYMLIDDWIAWKPSGNVWRPYNLKQVQSSGLEVQSKFRNQYSAMTLEAGVMYAYNRATLLKGITESDPAVGYQLPYTPMHRAGVFGNLSYKGYSFSINNQFTGPRLGIDVINEKVHAFLLTDIQLAKQFSFGRQLFSLEGSMLNAFNVDYQNINRYAMPGRNYLLSIQFFINN